MAQRKFIRTLDWTAGGLISQAALPTNDVILSTDLPDTAVTPGSFTNANITVDPQGRITAAASGSSLPSQTGHGGEYLTTDGTTASWAALGTAAALDYDTDTALAADSDALVATQRAVKHYVDNAVVGLLDFKGSTDCSANPDFPAALKGDAYVVSVAGRIGGASGIPVDLGDMFVATADNAGGTWAAVATSWTVLEHNLTGALLAANNLSDLASASAARTNLGLVIGTDVQAHNDKLDNLAALGTDGFIAWRSGLATYVARTMVGTANQVSILNGSGTGDPTFSLAGPHAYSTQTTHGILLGQGTGPVTATAVMTNGQILVGQTANDPLPKTVSGAFTLDSGGVATFAAVTSFTGADPAAADEMLGYDASAAGNRKFQADRLLGLLRVAPGGRLTLTTGTPVTMSDVTGATSIYYTPYQSDVIVLWDGTRWVAGTFAQTTLALGTLTTGKNYDVFGYLSAGALALESVAWTSDTVRATAVTLQDGRYCKNGDKTRLYLGTFRTTSTTQTEDSRARRFLFNAYNRVRRPLRRYDPSGAYSYSTAAWRVADGLTANKVEFVIGLYGDAVDLTHRVLAVGTSAVGYFGLGIDTTAAATVLVPLYFGGSAFNMTQMLAYADTLDVGYHYAQMLEYGGAGIQFDPSHAGSGIWGAVSG